jgi:hypothetical protein
VKEHAGRVGTLQANGIWGGSFNSKGAIKSWAVPRMGDRLTSELAGTVQETALIRTVRYRK